MNSSEDLPGSDYSHPPEGQLETWMAFPLGLERQADLDGFEHQLRVLSERYGPENVMPDFVEIDGAVYPGIKIFKPDSAVDRSTSEAWGRIFFSDG